MCALSMNSKMACNVYVIWSDKLIFDNDYYKLSFDYTP
jgi:hypothetical protein